MPRLVALLAGLAVLVATQLAAIAEQGEISGIDKVYLRGGPSTEDAPLGVLSAGDRVTIVGAAGAWANVQTADGKSGYVHHRYVVPLAGVGVETAPEVHPVTLPTRAPTQAPVEATPEPTVPAEADALSNELTELRSEVAHLKEQVRNYKQQATEALTAAPVEHTGAPPAQTSARDQAVGVFAVAVLSLLVGWALGSVFSRRRSRSHRPRLRI
jgi:uncharacterized protein YgiM (DUF1202 family)